MQSSDRAAERTSTEKPAYPTRVRSLLGIPEVGANVVQGLATPPPGYAYSNVTDGGDEYASALSPESFVREMTFETVQNEPEAGRLPEPSGMSLSARASSEDEGVGLGRTSPSSSERIAEDLPDYTRQRPEMPHRIERRNAQAESGDSAPPRESVAPLDMSIPGFSAARSVVIEPTPIETASPMGEAKPASASKGKQVRQAEGSREKVASDSARAAKSLGMAQVKPEIRSPSADTAVEQVLPVSPSISQPPLKASRVSATSEPLVSRNQSGSEVSPQRIHRAVGALGTAKGMPSQLLAAQSLSVGQGRVERPSQVVDATQQSEAFAAPPRIARQKPTQPRNTSDLETDASESGGEVLMDRLNRLADRVASQAQVSRETREESQTPATPAAPQPQPIVIVQRSAPRTRTTRAFWERRYLGRSGLKVLR